MNNQNFQEADTVVLRHALPAQGLEAGDVGAIVHIYPDSSAVEVEFMTAGAVTVAVLTLDATDVRLMDTHEILHVRKIPA